MLKEKRLPHGAWSMWKNFAERSVTNFGAFRKWLTKYWINFGNDVDTKFGINSPFYTHGGTVLDIACFIVGDEEGVLVD